MIMKSLLVIDNNWGCFFCCFGRKVGCLHGGDGGQIYREASAGKLRHFSVLRFWICWTSED